MIVVGFVEMVVVVPRLFSLFLRALSPIVGREASSASLRVLERDFSLFLAQ